MSNIVTEHDIKKLISENSLMRWALEDIANPIAALQRSTPKDCIFEGHIAVQICSRPEYYQEIARDTLAKIVALP